MTTTPTLVDAEAAVRAWINGNPILTGGTAPPLTQGAHLKRLDSVRGCYVHLLLIATTDGALTAEVPVGRARISGTVYGGKKDVAALGALAYANELWALVKLSGFPVTMGAATCRAIDNITGPLGLDDYETSHEQYRYLVDADFYLTP
jgi:hypothetical protein